MTKPRAPRWHVPATLAGVFVSTTLAAACAPAGDAPAIAQAPANPPAGATAPPAVASARVENAPRPAPARPKLVVLIVFDQFRGDYLLRWSELFGDDGFRRLMRDGAWYLNCNYPYSGTETGPGHASILSGCTPSKHGIAANDWRYRDDPEILQNCVRPSRHPSVPPADPPLAVVTDAPNGPGSAKAAYPGLFHAETFADVLQRETQRRGKVVALSLKDRGAVLPAGAGKKIAPPVFHGGFGRLPDPEDRPDAVYWFDEDLGRFVTSNYYRPDVHDWVKQFHAGPAEAPANPADRWRGQSWNRLRPLAGRPPLPGELDYERYSSRDDAPGEAFGRGESGDRQGVEFPHPFPRKNDKTYYQGVVCSPMGNELLWDFAEAAIAAEELGRDDAPDLLSVSFSSNDLVGHQWGPDSQEVLDVTLRTDLLVARLLRHLDEKVGREHYVLAMTADHGICPIPQYAAATFRLDVRRVEADELVDAANKHLTERFSPDAPEPRKWIERLYEGWFYLNRGVTARGITTADVETALVEWLRGQPRIEVAYRGDDVVHLGANDPFGLSIRRSFFPNRHGDVFATLTTGNLWVFREPRYDTGTSHGSPQPYDTYVPLIFYGANVRAERHGSEVTPLVVGPTFAEALGFPRPADAEYAPPPGVWITPHAPAASATNPPGPN